MPYEKDTINLEEFHYQLTGIENVLNKIFRLPCCIRRRFWYRF